jgi:N-acetylneuraminic acid mutarotase
MDQSRFSHFMDRLCKFSATIRQGNVYLFGGISYSPQKLHNDLWIYDTILDKWNKVKCTGDLPSERASHSAVCNGSEIVFFGGITNTGLTNEMYIFDFEDSEFIVIDPSDETPDARVQHTCVDTMDHKSMILFGGFTSKQQQNDLFQFDYEELEWKKLIAKGDVPSKRSGHGTCLIRDQMFVFGGNESQKGLCTSDIYSLELKGLIWKKMIVQEQRPQQRYNHSLLCVEDQLLCFGGWNGRGCFNDLWMFDLKQGIWYRLPPDVKIPAKTDHAAVICKDLLVFGGCDIDGPVRYQDSNMYRIPLNNHRLYMSLSRNEFIDCFVHIEKDPEVISFGSCKHGCSHGSH